MVFEFTRNAFWMNSLGLGEQVITCEPGTVVVLVHLGTLA